MSAPSTSQRVPGHTLADEGQVWNRYRRVFTGKARCSCGEKSPVLSSDGARKRWHREHKAAVLDHQTRFQAAMNALGGWT